MWPGFPVPKAATLPPNPTTITITVPKCEMPMFEFNSVIKEPDKCTCDIMMLMAVGCKCGQFQREQNKK